MKFKIKTLDHRDFSVKFSDEKTVWELKKHICRMRGIWLHPENQRILYAGQVLDDSKQLRTFCIDERKFLLMLPDKTSSPSQHRQLRSSMSLTSATSRSTTCTEETTAINVQPVYIPTDELKRYIMNLGPWKESEVRRALLISLNNPNRALDYLQTGISPFPKMITPPPSRLFLTKSEGALSDSKSKPKSPDKIEANTAESVDSGCVFDRTSSYDQMKSKRKSVTWKLSVHDCKRDVQSLINIGFPHDIVYEVYEACNRNMKETAILLFEHYFEEIERMQQ